MGGNACTGINRGQTGEPLTAQGGSLAFGESLKGMRRSERVNRHLPARGSNRGFGPDVFVQTLITLCPWLTWGDRPCRIFGSGKNLFRDFWIRR